jgi:shikimate dehydrogenase
MTRPERRWAEVIGDPIAHSKSPLLHRFWLERLGIEGDYERTRVEAPALPAFLAERRADPEWAGCNVTLPHKQAVLPLLDELDPLAARIGAVNTVVKDGDRLVGHNSDAPGFLEPLRARLSDRHLLRTARLFGTGGAARAIAHALIGEGFHLVLIGRTLEKAQALAAELGGGPDIHLAPLDAFATPLAFAWGDMDGRLDLAVNATSLGMTGQPPLPLDLSHLPPGASVYDAVYAPLETPLLAAARAAGHPVIDGLAMLIGQAAVAFRLFFGAEPPRDRDSDTALRAILTA